MRAGLGALAAAALAGCALFESTAPDRGPPPDGDRHTYVLSAMLIPRSSTEGAQLGLDLDGDDTADNALGEVLAALGTLAPDPPLDRGVARAIDHGELIGLVEIRAETLTTATGIGVRLLAGADPQPPACVDTADLVCRRHLLGDGRFALDVTAPPGTWLRGRIVNGLVTTGAGEVALPFTVGDGPVVTLPLHVARVALFVEELGIRAGSRLGGGVTLADVHDRLVPILQGHLATQVARDCRMPGQPPNCNCASGSSGQQILALFDKPPVDCAVNLEETHAVVDGFFAPDLDLDGDGENDALSLGVGVEAVAGTFPEPP